MKYLLIAMTALLSTACGHAHQVSIDPALQPYVDAFQAASVAEGKPQAFDDLVVQFGDTTKILPGDHTGYCSKSDFISPTITIDNSPEHMIMWNTYGEAYRQMLVFHELGHCVLGLAHDRSMWRPSSASADEPNSVMFPTLPVQSFYVSDKAHYLHQLFNPQ